MGKLMGMRSNSYGHDAHKSGWGYVISWTVDFPAGRLRYPSTQSRYTEEDGVKRFIKKWDTSVTMYKFKRELPKEGFSRPVPVIIATAELKHIKGTQYKLTIFKLRSHKSYKGSFREMVKMASKWEDIYTSIFLTTV